MKNPTRIGRFGRRNSWEERESFFMKLRIGAQMI
jgi:hypothetical protein